MDGRGWVVPPGEARAQEVESAAEARDALGANLALTGTVRRERSRVSLTLNLLDTRTGRQIRSESIEVAASAVGSLQAEALLAIGRMLGLEDATLSTLVSPEALPIPTRTRTTIQGLGYLERNEAEGDLDRAVSLFERAIEQDSAFALAYARLGQASLQQYEVTRDSAWVGRAEAAARRAVALDPDEPLAHVALSRLYRVTGRYPLATREANEALRLDSATLTRASRSRKPKKPLATPWVRKKPFGKPSGFARRCGPSTPNWATSWSARAVTRTPPSNSLR